MKHKGQGRYGLGAASLILILLVLCLALLGILSLMSARADLSLSRRHASLAMAYAQATEQVQAALGDLDAQLAGAWQDAEDETAFARACTQIVSAAGNGIEWLDDRCARFCVDAGEERAIVVEIERSLWDDAANKRYIITKHALTDMKEWEQTESLILMGM